MTKCFIGAAVAEELWAFTKPPLLQENWFGANGSRSHEKAEIEEVPLNMYCISSVTEYIIIEVSQNIPIYTYSATFAYNGISFIKPS